MTQVTPLLPPHFIHYTWWYSQNNVILSDPCFTPVIKCVAMVTTNINVFDNNCELISVVCMIFVICCGSYVLVMQRFCFNSEAWFPLDFLYRKWRIVNCGNYGDVFVVVHLIRICRSNVAATKFTGQINSWYLSERIQRNSSPEVMVSRDIFLFQIHTDRYQRIIQLQEIFLWAKTLKNYLLISKVWKWQRHCFCLNLVKNKERKYCFLKLNIWNVSLFRHKKI